VQLRHYVEFQKELAINYCKLVVASVDPPEVNAALRAGLDAEFPFLSDHDRKVVQALDMTETSKSRGVTAMPYTFSLMPDLTISQYLLRVLVFGPADIGGAKNGPARNDAKGSAGFSRTVGMRSGCKRRSLKARPKSVTILL